MYTLLYFTFNNILISSSLQVKDQPALMFVTLDTAILELVFLDLYMETCQSTFPTSINDSYLIIEMRVCQTV